MHIIELVLNVMLRCFNMSMAGARSQSQARINSIVLQAVNTEQKPLSERGVSKPMLRNLVFKMMHSTAASSHDALSCVNDVFVPCNSADSSWIGINHRLS